MKNTITTTILSLLTIAILGGPATAQTGGVNPEARLKELGIKLKTPPPPSANFIGAVRVGNLVFLSGQGPLKEDGTYLTGKVGKEFNLEEARLENLHRNITILVLGALVLAGDDNAGWQVGDPDGRIGGVDMLSAGSG